VGVSVGLLKTVLRPARLKAVDSKNLRRDKCLDIAHLTDLKLWLKGKQLLFPRSSDLKSENTG